MSLPGNSTSPRAGSPAVLAVDDRPANLLALEAVLEPLNVEMVSASSGREAIRLASERPFAVALIDVVMPDMDGFQTVSEIRALPLARLTPIILLTAYEFDPRDIESLQGTALIDYVGKPIAPGLLRGKVEALVSLYCHREMLAAKDRDIAMLAHDLQTPLASITAGTDLLLRSAPTDRLQTVAGRVVQTVQRMSAMVTDLTDYARAGQGPIPVNLRETDLRAVMERVADECHHLERGDRIRVDAQGDLRGQWDADRLQQAMANLIVNALRYGDGDVWLRGVDAGPHVELSVHNAGGCIAAERLPTIFEPFRRGTSVGKGLGLGLFIVREIAAAHGGTVEVTSTPDGGTTFVVRLPRQPSTPDRRAAR
jgi:signal transduction histidine kinase